FFTALRPFVFGQLIKLFTRRLARRSLDNHESPWRELAVVGNPTGNGQQLIHLCGVRAGLGQKRRGDSAAGLEIIAQGDIDAHENNAPNLLIVLPYDTAFPHSKSRGGRPVAGGLTMGGLMYLRSVIFACILALGIMPAAGQ